MTQAARNSQPLRFTHYVLGSIRRPGQGSPACDLATDKHDLGAHVSARVVIAIKVTFQKEVAAIRHLAERPITGLLHRGAFIKPDHLHTAIAGLTLENLRR